VKVVVGSVKELTSAEAISGCTKTKSNFHEDKQSRLKILQRRYDSQHNFCTAKKFTTGQLNTNIEFRLKILEHLRTKKTKTACTYTRR